VIFANILKWRKYIMDYLYQNIFLIEETFI